MSGYCSFTKVSQASRLDPKVSEAIGSLSALKEFLHDDTARRVLESNLDIIRGHCSQYL
jgi:hypothetical protein